MDNWCEKGIIALVLGILVFGPLATGAVRSLEFLVIQGLTVLALFLWLTRIWLNATYRLLWPPVCWAVLAFVLYTIFRYRTSDLEFVARGELIRVLTYAILFFIIVNNFVRQDSIQILSYVLIGLAMLIAAYAIVQFATNSERVWHFIKPAEYVKRGSGTYICPNHLGGFLEMLLPLGLALSLTGRVKPVPRVFLAYASLVILVGIAVSISRGAWIATGVSLLTFFALLIQQRRYRLPALLAIVVLIGGAVIFYRSSRDSQHRVQPMLSSGIPDDSQMRLAIWKAATHMWREHVWLGVGPGHYDYRFPQYRPALVQIRPGYVHNDYLNCLVDWGVVGVALVGCAWGLVFAGVFQTWKFVRREESALGTRPSNRAAFVFGASIGLVAILVHSIVDFNMQVPANAILAVALMALLSSHMRFASERYWVRLGLIGRIIATVVGAAGIVYLVSQGTQKAAEYRWFARARAESAPAPKLDALRNAAAVDPANFETTLALGESLWNLSSAGETGYEKQATEAIEWFRRGTRLNPYDTHNHLGIGMCLDWLGRHDEAAPFYEQALKLDPRNYFLLAHQGWHFVQTGDYEKARFWFNESLAVNRWHNPIASRYLEIVERKLKEKSPAK